MNKATSMFSEFEPSSKNDWLEKVRKATSDEELKSLFKDSPDGFKLGPYYDFEDLSQIDFKDSLPGSYPFVNGFSRSGFPALRAAIRMDKFMKTGQLIQEAVKFGADEIFLSGDYFGSDNELNQLLNSLDIRKTSLHADFGESNAAFAFILADEISRRGLDPKEIKGSIYVDFLGDLASRGNYDYSADESLKLLVSMLQMGREQLPSVKLLNISGSRFHEAGATAGMELGFLFAQLTEYFNLLTDKGFTPEELAKTVQIQVSVSAEDYFGSIAKLRALRILWANWAEAFEIPEDIKPQICAVSSLRNKTAFDEYSNLLRLTAEGMAAFAGGCDSLCLWPHDDSFRMPGENSLQLAGNIHHLLRYESKMQEVTDVAAGSYYIETLTDKLTDAAWVWFTECEKKGGFTASLQAKYIQGVIEIQANKEQAQFNEGKKVLIGANKYPQKQEKMMEIIQKNPSRTELKDELSILPIRARRLAENLENAKLKAETDLIRKEAEAEAGDDNEE